MSMSKVREGLDRGQIGLYLSAVLLGAFLGLVVPGTTALEVGVNPALALMLFVTFLQVPLSDLRHAFAPVRFVVVLLGVNFILVPLMVAILVTLVPDDPLVRLGVLLVLLTPCIDYVVTFSHLGRADARALLAATPALLIVQMLLLPIYLAAFLGEEAARLVHLEPFVHAFIWLIALPLGLAALVQLWARRSETGARLSVQLGLLPVPATALVLFIVVAAVVPRLAPAIAPALAVVPIYVSFAILAPAIGWIVARLLHLDAPAARSVAFSAATRNSLVVMPLAFAVPEGVPVLPAVIVTQTLIELVSELVYVRIAPRLGTAAASSLKRP